MVPLNLEFLKQHRKPSLTSLTSGTSSIGPNRRVPRGSFCASGRFCLSCLMTSSFRGKTPLSLSSFRYCRAEWIWPAMTRFANTLSLYVIIILYCSKLYYYYILLLFYILLFAGWKVRIVKNCDRSLEMLPEAAGQGQHFQVRGHSFSLYGPTLRR